MKTISSFMSGVFFGTGLLFILSALLFACLGNIAMYYTGVLFGLISFGLWKILDEKRKEFKKEI